MEADAGGGKASPDKGKEDENRESDTTNADGNNQSPSVADAKKLSTLESTTKPTDRESKAPSKTILETEIEGEDQGTSKEPAARGPTLTQYQYDRTKDDYDEIAKNLRDNAMKTMLRMLELQAAQRPSQPSTSRHFSQVPSLPNASSLKNLSMDTRMNVTGGADVETQLKELERKLKSSVTRVTESRREQAHLMSLINNLEVQMYRTEEAECIKEMMNKVPEEADLDKMKRLQLVMLERKRLEKEIQRLQMEIRAMNNAMASADVIISESSPIKKPRRVVIRDASGQREGLSEYGSGSGKGEWSRGMGPSPEIELPESAGSSAQENEETDDGRKHSSESEDEGEISESEVKATPAHTRGKKPKK